MILDVHPERFDKDRVGLLQYTEELELIKGEANFQRNRA